MPAPSSPEEQRPPDSGRQTGRRLQDPRTHLSWIYVFAAIFLLVMIQSMMRELEPREMPYSEFLRLVRDGRIERADIGGDRIVAQLKPEGAAAGAEAPAAAAKPAAKAPAKPSPRGDRAKSAPPQTPAFPPSPPAPGEQPPSPQPTPIIVHRLPGVDESDLVRLLDQHGVAFKGLSIAVPWWQSALMGWVLPIALLVGVYWFIMRRMGRGSGPLSFGKTRAKIYDRNKDERVTFADVAGVDEAKGELVEVVSFLRQPERFRSLGARAPKGVLLVGPPGTGKTLLARAVAGEADVPFFSMSGSDFVEMFVGVGASRMRDLFNQAKERAPCIIFIDELDAIGKSRGGIGAMATHDEREQTLNQLLVEMDGFEGGKGVVIMGATNRPEVLDQALLRAGRFDRQVVVDRPDVRGREEILAVHARKVRMHEGVDLRLVASRTPGMVGADLANVVNEAALAAASRNAQSVDLQDFEEAIDRIQLGLKKRGGMMNADEKRRVAYHEAGHALVALSVEHADPVHRVTIIPRSIGALGVTLQLPTEERYLITQLELQDRICVMFGGRAAEELIFRDVSTGAQNDLERATETARQMVCRFGMSEALGPLTYGQSQTMRFLGIPLGVDGERQFSERTATTIDDEVRAIIEEAMRRARDILHRRKAALEAIASDLLVKETLERQELERLVERR